MSINKQGVIFDKNRMVSRLFQISVALWFLRMVLPGVKYLLIPSLVILIFSIFISLKGNMFKRQYVYEFLKTFNPLILLGIFFIVGIIISDNFYDKAFRDLAEYFINLFYLTVFFALTY